jgi:hypothetical protein
MSHDNAAAPDVQEWRTRWRSAAESAFPFLMTDPQVYAQALETVGLLAADFRRREVDLDGLAAAMSRPDELRAVTASAPAPPGVPIAMLVGVACSMRERDLITQRVRDGRRRAIHEARAAGRTWAILEGPEQVEQLSGGSTGSACAVHLHLPTGTELRASVNAWSTEPYSVDVVRPGVAATTGATFARREPWINEVNRVRADIEDSG